MANETLHPRVIPGTERVVGHTPSGAPLLEWLEEYPDGTIKVFREINDVVVGSYAGNRYGITRVIRVS